MVCQTKYPLELRDNDGSSCDGCPERCVTGDNDGLGSISESAFDTGLLIVFWTNVSFFTGVFEIFLSESSLSEYVVSV